MNERIRELWDKAAESTAAYPSGQNNSWETQVNFMEKFAELIMKECANEQKSIRVWGWVWKDKRHEDECCYIPSYTPAQQMNNG